MSCIKNVQTGGVEGGIALQDGLFLNVYYYKVSFWSHKGQASEATVSYSVIQSPRNTEDVCSIPGMGRYILARMTT